MNDPFSDARLSNTGDGPGQIRLWPIVLVVVVTFTLFIGRLFQLQILEGEDLATRSQANYVRTVRLEAQRGAIVDREGRTIAASRPAYGVDLIPNEIRNPWRTYSVLGAILGRDPDEIAAQVGQPRGRRRFQPVSLSRDLALRERAQIAAHRYAMPGVELYRKPLRDYVYRDLAAQLIGTIGEIGTEELEKESFSGYRSGETIGKTGVEASSEKHLRGRAGGVNLIVDVAGREIDEIDRLEPTPGGRLVLSLDLDLQRVAEAAFDSDDPEKPDRMGALVALDPRNGDVLALVSAPAYDANAFAGGVDRETWGSLSRDEWRPLRNRALAGVYPPGSTYKAIVAAAGLAEGVIEATTVVTCPGHFRLGRRVYRCWKRGGHGPVDLEHALLGSCDVYFYELGKTLGVETLARYARLFGLGTPTGIGVRGEVAGLVPTPEWKLRARGERWIDGETISLSIGQGANLTTPIQLAVAYAAIANGGHVVEPRIVLRSETWDGVVVSETEPGFRAENIIAEPILEMVKKGLAAVVMDPEGTGRRARVPGIDVAGKSGTTQVVSLQLVEGLEPEEIPIRHRDHALFAAFAPVESPEIVVVAIAEHAGGGGGAVAAPMVQKVMAKYFQKKEGRVPTQLAAISLGDGPEAGGGQRGAMVSWLPAPGRGVR
ncbi:MAG: penicillin-binding protein 2 [Deltaproteobacteria bacterium]|nr:penicillin-binding protein 2 [Deltaproteobacteria bacterium]